MTEKEFDERIWPLAGPVYAFAAHLTGDRDGAADVTREVMARLWENRKALQPGSEPLPGGLAERIRQGFRVRRHRRTRRITAVFTGMAASLVLVLALERTFAGFSSGEVPLSDSVKRERLENALRTVGRVLEGKNGPGEKILYEDSRLVIAIE